MIYVLTDTNTLVVHKVSMKPSVIRYPNVTGRKMVIE